MHIRDINKFCVQNSVGVPFEELAQEVNSFILTESQFHKGYVDEDIWVESELEFTSYLTTKFFSCSIKLNYHVENPEDIVTSGHLIVEEIGFKWLKISFM